MSRSSTAGLPVGRRRDFRRATHRRRLPPRRSSPPVTSAGDEREGRGDVVNSLEPASFSLPPRPRSCWKLGKVEWRKSERISVGQLYPPSNTTQPCPSSKEVLQAQAQMAIEGGGTVFNDGRRLTLRASTCTPPVRDEEFGPDPSIPDVVTSQGSGRCSSTCNHGQQRSWPWL